MPRGRKVNMKGRAKTYTDPEELERQRRSWRSKKEETESSEEEEEEEADSDKSGSGSDSDSGSDEGAGKPKAKAAAAKTLPDVENPNRAASKPTKKVSELDGEESKPQLSRREREEIEKQRAREHYLKLHAQGKTDEARADLARLAIIRQQREEAARKREAEKQQKEAEKVAKADIIQKTIGKRV